MDNIYLKSFCLSATLGSRLPNKHILCELHATSQFQSANQRQTETQAQLFLRAPEKLAQEKPLLIDWIAFLLLQIIPIHLINWSVAEREKRTMKL